MQPLKRREFLRLSGSALAAAAGLPCLARADEDRREFLLSLSERSLSRRLAAGEIGHLDLAHVARKEFELEAIDYASRFFKEHVDDEAYLTRMNKRAADQGVRQVLLLVDGEGSLGAKGKADRSGAVRNHRRWIDAAQALGCRAVCIQVLGDGSAKEQLPRVVEGLAQLAEYGANSKVNVLVANDAGSASDPAWLMNVIKQVDSPRCRAFPSFTGFGKHDPYEGMTRLMEVAKGVCAASHTFNGEGNETKTDFARMMQIVLEAGYRGYVSLEYQGEKLEEFAGIRATKALLEKIRKELT